MAILTIAQLKALWIDGFIPDQDDYADMYDSLEAIAGGAAVALLENQIAFADAAGNIEGSEAIKWDDESLIIQGSGVDRFIRMAESAGAFNGGFIQMEGATNKFHIGVHDANDADAANDTKVITILRSNGNVGVGTETPTEAFEVVGSIKVDGALIAPTFTNITNRLAVELPSFGGTRLGDAALQSPTIDVKVLTFKGDNQETVSAFFVNGAGDTMTIRSGTSPIRVTDFASAPFDIATESGESTMANSIEDNGGGRYINDQGVQHYITNGSVVAQASFQVLQNTGGLTRIKHWVGRYDGTTYDMAYEIGVGNVVTFQYPIKAPDGVAPDDLVTKAQLDAAGGGTPENMVTTDTAQTITGAKTFQGNVNVTGFLIAGVGVSGANIEVKDSALPTGTQNNGAAALLKAGDGSGQLVWLGKTGTGAMIFDNGAVTTARTYAMPNKSGTVAMLDDIPVVTPQPTERALRLIESGVTILTSMTFPQTNNLLFSYLMPANSFASTGSIRNRLKTKVRFSGNNASDTITLTLFRTDSNARQSLSSIIMPALGFNSGFWEMEIANIGGSSPAYYFSLRQEGQNEVINRLLRNTDWTQDVLFELEVTSTGTGGMIADQPDVYLLK